MEGPQRPAPLLPRPSRLPTPSPTRAPPSPQGDFLCRRNEPEYKSNLGGWVYRCRPPTTGQAPHCNSDYSLCQTARACKEKRVCKRKIDKCAKKVRKKPGKWHKCLKKWETRADGACTNLKTQRKCPASCGVCG